MSQRAIIIGMPGTCRRLERQLDLLSSRPESLGWVVADEAAPGDPVLGSLDDLESVVRRSRPELALVTLPCAMGRLIRATRTRLRRLGVADRFIPTLEDQIAGIGPRGRLEIDHGELLQRASRPVDEQAIRRVIEGRCVLITGAGGTIGGELARLVCHYGARRLVLVERSENALFEIDRQVARRAPRLARKAVLHDVVNASQTLMRMRELEPQVIFHAAAHKHVPMMEDHPAAAVDNNFFGTRSVADAADAVGAERFVLISTDKAVNPRSVMGATKRLAELYVQHLNVNSETDFAVVRFGNVLGSTGSVLDVWSSELAEGGPLTVTDPRMTRFFMTISEAAALVIQAAALAPDTPGEVLLLDMGEPIRVLDLARRFIALHGFDPATVRIVFTGARPGEKLHEQLAYDVGAVRPTAHPAIRGWRDAAPPRERIDEIIAALSIADPSNVAGTVLRLAGGLAGGLTEPAAA